jgi:hypothetical protein
MGKYILPSVPFSVSSVAVAGLALIAPGVLAAGQQPLPAAATSKTAAVAPSYDELELRSAPGAASAMVTAPRTKPFSLVGVTWPYRTDSAQVVVKVRVQRDGRWTAWEQLHVDDGPDPARGGAVRSGTEPIWVGTASGVQVTLTTLDGTTVRGAKVALIEAGTRPGDESVRPDAVAAGQPAQAPQLLASAAPVAMPAIISRHGWGADETLRSYNGASCATPRYTQTVQAAFVHHTADTNNYTSAQVPAMLRATYAYHVKSQGWCDIGYNFLVDKFGRAWEGRAGGMHLPVLGAHTGGYNANSFGVSLIGNFDTATPSAAIMETTARIIAWKFDANYRSPVSTVVLAGKRLNTISGHRDTKPTACPGAYVYSRLGALRQRVSALMGGSVSTEIYRFAQYLGGFRVVGQPVWGEHPTRTGRGTWFEWQDIYYSAATGVHSIKGAWRARYRGMGPADGVLGLPTTEDRRGRLTGSWVQKFRYGAMYWSNASGVQPTYGKIAQTYTALGAELSRLGLPTTGLYRVTGGLRQRYQRGAIAWNTSTGAVSVTYSATS